MAEQNQKERGGYLDKLYCDLMNVALEYLYGAYIYDASHADDYDVEDQPVVAFLERGVPCVPQGYYGDIYSQEELMRHIIDIL